MESRDENSIGIGFGGVTPSKFTHRRGGVAILRDEFRRGSLAALGRRLRRGGPLALGDAICHKCDVLAVGNCRWLYPP